MIKEKASKKWCPFAIGFTEFNEGLASVNRYWNIDDKVSEPMIECLCLTDQCMAWTWETSDESFGGYCALIRKKGE